jgi:hypothetical protein
LVRYTINYDMITMITNMEALPSWAFYMEKQQYLV